MCTFKELTVLIAEIGQSVKCFIHQCWGLYKEHYVQMETKRIVYCFFLHDVPLVHYSTNICYSLCLILWKAFCLFHTKVTRCWPLAMAMRLILFIMSKAKLRTKLHYCVENNIAPVVTHNNIKWHHVYDIKPSH